LRDKEYSIAAMFDGTLTVEEVAAKFAEKSGMVVKTEDFAKFQKRLESLGLFEGGDAKVAVPSDPGLWKKRTLLQKVLFYKIKAVNPDKFLERIAPVTNIFFSRAILPLYFLLFFIAVSIVLSNRLELAFQLKRSMTPQIIIHIWLTIIFLTWLHELSHALTCKRHGGKVSEFGMLLLYLQICFYVNVSDAYLFEDKKKRIKVTLAGVKNQIVIWTLAVIVWRVTEIGTFINQTAFIVTAVTLVMIIFNINPLLKLDGYYYLVDKWGIPNLRSRAFNYWREWLLRNLFGVRTEQTDSLRERRIFHWYGLASIAYSFGLFGYILYQVNGFIADHLGILGLAILYGIVLYLVAEAIKKTGILKQARSQRGAILRPKTWLIIIIVIAGLGILSAIIKLDLKVSQDCLIYPIEIMSLQSSDPGYVELVLDRGSGEKNVQQFSLSGADLQVLSINPLVKEGDQIKKGQVIARVSSPESEASLAESRANLDRAKSQLELLKKGPRPEEISQVDDQIKQVRLNLKKSDSDLARSEELAQKGMISKDQLEQARTTNEVLKSELDFYTRQRKLLKDGARPEEIEIAEAEMRAIQAKIDKLESQIAAANIVSPLDGVVTIVRTGEEFLTVARIDTMRVRIPVPEKEISDVRPGNIIKFRTRSYPGITFDGKVARISEQTEEGELQPIFVVTAEAPNAEGLLKSGMTGHAKIYCGKERAFKIMFKRFVRWFRVEFWGWY